MCPARRRATASGAEPAGKPTVRRATRAMVFALQIDELPVRAADWAMKCLRDKAVVALFMHSGIAALASCPACQRDGIFCHCSLNGRSPSFRATPLGTTENTLQSCGRTLRTIQVDGMGMVHGAKIKPSG